MSSSGVRASAGPGGSFFVTGGTMRPGAVSYVARDADHDLLDALEHGEFCYVLDTRQMGKSSLMARVARQLRRQGCSIAIVDLTAIGQNLLLDQWYDSQVDTIGRQLGLEEPILEFRELHRLLGPLERLVRTIREVVMTKLEGPVVIFVDEIDFVRSLPFSTDEFFAGIRQFYNSRANDPDLDRLTFCLLGVSTPNELIRAVEVTPFNLGRRIVIQDFNLADAEKVLLPGLSSDPAAARSLMERVFYWTDGHPYLTQRLCDAVAVGGGSTPADVDRACDELFLSPGAREQNDNLRFVGNRLLVPGIEADTLAIYSKLLRDEPVPEKNPFAEVLRLSGIGKVVGGKFQVRNRIYRRVFDLKWIDDNMPDREMQLIADVARRTRRRTLSYAAVALAAVGSLGAAGYYVYQANLWRNQYNLMKRLKSDADQSREQADIARADAAKERDIAVKQGAVAGKSAEAARLAVIKAQLAEHATEVTNAKLAETNDKLAVETQKAKDAESDAKTTASGEKKAREDSDRALTELKTAEKDKDNLIAQLKVVNGNLVEAQSTASTFALAGIADMLRQAQPRSIELSALLAVEAAGKVPSLDTYRSLRNIASLLPRFQPPREIGVSAPPRDHALSPNQRYLAMDYRTQVCEMDLGAEGPAKCAPASGVDQLVVTDEGSVLYSSRGAVQKGDLLQTQELRPLQLTGAPSSFDRPVLQARGCLVATGTTADRVLVIDTCNAQSYTLRQPKARGHSPVAFDAAGKYLLTAWINPPTAGNKTPETLGLWQLDTRKLVDSKDGWEACDTDQFSADLRRHYCTTNQGEKVESLRLSPIESPPAPFSFTEKSSQFAFSTDGRLFARATRTGVFVYRDGRLVIPLQVTDSVQSVEFSQRGDLIKVKTTVTGQSLARVFDLNGAEQSRMSLLPESDVFFAGNQMVLLADRTVRMYRPQAGLNTPLTTGTLQSGGILKLTPDGRYLVTGAMRQVGRTQFYDTGAPGSSPVEVVSTSSGIPEEFSADGSVVLVGDAQQRYTAIATASRAILRRLSTDGSIVAVSPDARSVAFMTRTCPGIGQRSGTSRCIVLESVRDGSQHILPVEPTLAVFSRDGARLYTLSSQGDAGTWEADSGKALSVERLPAAPQIALADPNGNFFLTGTGASETTLWDTRIHTIRKLPVALSRNAAISGDGRYLATASGSRVSIYSLADGSQASVITVPGLVSRTLQFNHAGSRLAVVTSSSVYMLSVVDRNLSRPLEAEGSTVIGFSASDDQFAILQPPSSRVAWYRSDILTEAGGFQLPGIGWRPRLSPDGRWLAIGAPATLGAPIRVMSLNPVVQVDTSFLSDAAPTALAIGTGSPLTLAAAGADGNIRVVAPYAVPPKTLTANYGGTVTAIAFSPDLRFLVAGGDKGLVSFNTADGGKVAQFPFPAARYMAYPREDSILVATGLGILHAFSPAFGQRTEPFPRETVSSILESAGNAITATVNPDFIRLWKANDQSGDLKIGAKTTGEPKFSSSGKLLAARVVLSERPGQSAVRVWSTQTGAPVVTVEVSYDVVSFAFSPDETVLGIASTGTIELWPLDSTVKTPIGSIPSVSSIADIGFLPQGELLVAARSGGSFLTPWRRQDLIRGVCSVLTRNTALTPTELQTYGLANNYRDYCAGKIPNIRY